MCKTISQLQIWEKVKIRSIDFIILVFSFVCIVCVKVDKVVNKWLGVGGGGILNMLDPTLYKLNPAC